MLEDDLGINADMAQMGVRRGMWRLHLFSYKEISGHNCSGCQASHQADGESLSATCNNLQVQAM